jgi:protein gp37
MSDLFHDQVPDAYIAEVFSVMARASQHTFQVLTKRHGRMRSLLNRPSFRDNFAHLAQWPLPNVWMGVSVENQQWADIRIPALLDTPAAVRWISAEPLLGPVDLDGPLVDGHRPRLTYWLTGRPGWGPEETSPNGLVTRPFTTGPRLDWVVAGGESGPCATSASPPVCRSSSNSGASTTRWPRSRTESSTGVAV